MVQEHGWERLPVKEAGCMSHRQLATQFSALPQAFGKARRVGHPF